MPNPALSLSLPKAARKAGITSRRSLDRLLKKAYGYTLKQIVDTTVEDGVFLVKQRKASALTTHTTLS